MVRFWVGPHGLRRVEWSRRALADDASLAALLAEGEGLAPTSVEQEPVEEVQAAFEQYLDGELDAFSSVEIDLGGLSEFAARVLSNLRAIPGGAVTTYGSLAAWSGKAGAARAVGRIVGANPVPLVIPCHRVVAADGSLGGFSGGGGLASKRWLLAHEGVIARAGRWRSRRRP